MGFLFDLVWISLILPDQLDCDISLAKDLFLKGVDLKYLLEVPADELSLPLSVGLFSSSETNRDAVEIITRVLVRAIAGEIDDSDGGGECKNGRRSERVRFLALMTHDEIKEYFLKVKGTRPQRWPRKMNLDLAFVKDEYEILKMRVSVRFDFSWILSAVLC